MKVKSVAMIVEVVAMKVMTVVVMMDVNLMIPQISHSMRQVTM